MLAHFSLCSGIGGLDLAAEWAGFTTIAQCEIDEYASKVLAKNFPGVPNLHDIRTITNSGLAEYGIDGSEITVISAGFPCQPYSLAGKGRSDSDSRDLWGEVARVLGEIRPPWFVGENTPGLFARQNQRFFRRVLDDLASLGYSVGWGIWGACDVGAPHRRERVFIIGHRNISDTLCKRRMDEQVKIFATERGEQTFCNTLKLCGNFSNAACKRCYKDEVQRGKPEKGWNKTYGRETTESGMQFKRICKRISDTSSDIMGMYGSEQQAQEVAGRRNNNGARAERNASGELWKAEPDVVRVADGIPARVDRLRCLGNAVVPQQAYPIFKAIAEYEKEKG